MHETSSALKNISRLILYAGAVACFLAGFGAACILAASFTPSDLDRPSELATLPIYICLSITPAVMFIKGVKNKTWQWIFIAIVEVIVLALALWVLIALIMMARNGFGE